ncbi:MAG: aspartate dehydrogenase [Candidatus Omnitrophica bacterium]|nr:aspartate dehydrogenase [Candidatus Omnitrophota bacterium]
MDKIRIGIVGCGTIGSAIAQACFGRLKDRVSLVALSDSDPAKSADLRKKLKSDVPSVDLDQLVKKSDLVVEAASSKVSSLVLGMCIEAGRDCLVMSVGGLVGNDDLLKKANELGVKVFIPSGAICGVDGLKSASCGTIESVILTTRKPIKGLEGAPYIKDKKLDLASIKTETVIFEGNAEEAVRAFPQNVNVSAVLSLAGIGPKKTIVRIVTSPEYSKNVHEVEISGEFGKITTRTENIPSKTNPKTSAMAFFSAIATLEGITRSVRIGT